MVISLRARAEASEQGCTGELRRDGWCLKIHQLKPLHASNELPLFALALMMHLETRPDMEPWGKMVLVFQG